MQLLAVPAVEPLSLYIGLVAGRKADLEIIARASLAFASAIREVAYAVDPSLELRIELVSGTESSLSLNSLLTSKIRGKLAKLTLASVAIGAMNWFTQETMHYAFDKTLDRSSSRRVRPASFVPWCVAQPTPQPYTESIRGGPRDADKES
jgi:hypothetical protein